MRERRWPGGVGALALVFAALLAATAAAATLSWGQPHPLRALPASAPNDAASLTAIACFSLRSCAAVGDFGYDLHTDPSTSVTQGEGLSESAGVWDRARQIVLPANAATVDKQQAEVQSVACPAAGSCVAVGAYDDRAGTPQAMVVSESAGAWGRAREIATPSTGGGALLSVSCAGRGSCTAVGSYDDGSGNSHLLAVSESGGRWGSAQQVMLPANVSPAAGDQLGSVSCPTPGACTAVGYDYASSGANPPADGAIVVDESGGVWGRAQPIALSPTFGRAQSLAAELDGVACTAARSCAAVGDYNTIPPPPSTSFGREHGPAMGAHDSDSSSTSHAIVASEAGGTWGVATGITLPAGAGSGQNTGLDSVACPRRGACVAVGQYDGRAGAVLAMSVEQAGGRWDAATKVTLPGGQSGLSVSDSLDSVACPTPGSCAALAGDSVVTTR